MASSDQSNSSMETEFKHFDVVAETPSDHHFVSSNNNSRQNFTVATNPSLHKLIMQEWKILGKNLPESIFVRVYETRIDLLRAVIIGSPDTPYHNGLFFFDIVLPCQYPKDPPNVYYHSHGHRLNPNLYGSGKVCLSLLNTWYGKKEELWSDKSTILQILVSIQGLVLNARPYFNEPGYHGGMNSLSSAWVNASISYNYTALMLSCKTMMLTIRNPPAGFEAFVDHHFKERARSILAFVDDYRHGRALGGQFPLKHRKPKGAIKVSETFKAQLDEIQVKLRRSLGCDDDSETSNRGESVTVRVEEAPEGSFSASAEPSRPGVWFFVAFGTIMFTFFCFAVFS